MIDPQFKRGETDKVIFITIIRSAVGKKAARQPEQVRILPPEYNYPYHLHKSLSPERRVVALHDLVTFIYEDWPINPARMDDIQVNEPFKSWLLKHL